MLGFVDVIYIVYFLNVNLLVSLSYFTSIKHEFTGRDQTTRYITSDRARYFKPLLVRSPSCNRACGKINACTYAYQCTA